MKNKPFTDLFDILQAEEHMETECSLLIEVAKATLHPYTKFMISNKVFPLVLSQEEEKMETGREGTSSTAETIVCNFHDIIFY